MTLGNKGMALTESAETKSPRPDLSIRRRAPEATADISLLDLLIVLARRWRALLAGTAAAAVLAGIISLLLPNRFTATTVILPPQQNTSSTVALLGQLGGANPLA